ncbi:GLPGLI family protein [Polaribacter sp. Asnod6-C07]|uniref:GLPGLI family protein n=1 Tax=Polaribacter sp. Asnod6-C07 TaxID=3160582 RepID=UPI00386E0AC1
MKKILFILLVSSLSRVCGQSIKNGEIIYKISVSKENIKEYNEKRRIKFKNKFAIKYWDDFYQESNYTEGVLKFNGLKSSYQIKKKLKNEGKISLTTLDIFAGGRNIYFVDILKKETIVLDSRTLGESFLISYDFQKWELTQNFRIINGYKCYLAKSETIGENKKTILAWYTNDIPTTFGPMFYSGLPGLILELDDGTLSYKAKKIKLNNKKKILIEEKGNGISITREEFLKLAKKSFPKELFKNK